MSSDVSRAEIYAVWTIAALFCVVCWVTVFAFVWKAARYVFGG